MEGSGITPYDGDRPGIWKSDVVFGGACRSPKPSSNIVEKSSTFMSSNKGASFHGLMSGSGEGALSPRILGVLEERKVKRLRLSAVRSRVGSRRIDIVSEERFGRIGK